MENNIPSSNTTHVSVESGSVFVIKAGQGAVLITGNYQLKPDEVLLVTPGANATVSGQGQQLHIQDTQSTVSIVPNVTGPIATVIGPEVQINPVNAANANFSESDIADIQRSVVNQQDPTLDIANPGHPVSDDTQSGQHSDIATIQHSILAGQDPSKVTEAPAAGETAGPTANNSFVTVEYDHDAVLTEAGFTTYGFERDYHHEDDERALVLAKGGESLNVDVTEGDLDSGVGYPTQSTSSVVVAKGTYALDPDSFYIPQDSVDPLLDELNSEITSGGEPVQFSYDPETNTFVGMQDGEQVMSIDVDFTALPNGDMTVTVTTTINQPVDHISGDNSGMVTDMGDDIHIDFPISGSDIGGNEIKEPIDIGVDIHDGANEEFGTDPGVTVNESDDLDTVVDGQVPLDLGSDEIATIVFDPNQPSLDGLTSNGEPTDYTVDGNTLTVTDVNGEPVLTVIVQTDGSYTVEVTGPLDQDAYDITNLDLGITATDDDGDQASGSIIINIEDGTNADDVSDAVTITEGDLENPAEGNGYPVHGSSSVTVASPDDNIDPTTLRLSDEGKAQLLTEMSDITTHNGEPVEFAYSVDDNGVVTITGVDGNGQPVLDITMTPTMNENGDVTVVTDVNQYQPLDDINGEGDSNGLITNNGDVISVELPLLIDDTDGDTSSVNITVNFEDGQDPSFGDDTGVNITESDDTQTATGSIDFDQGSDAVDQIVFDASQPSLDGITTNGEATSYSVDGNTLSMVDADGDPVMDVTIDADGNYEVTQYQPIDQNDGDVTNIELNVSGTDADGDTANGTIHINITDGENAADVTDDVTITEGDLENPAEGNGYPVHGSSSVTVASPDDNIDPSTLRLSDEGKAQLLTEMSDITTHNGEPVEFAYSVDDKGVVTITGVDDNGKPVLDITMTPTMNENGDVTVVTDVNQYQPLDDINGEGDSNGLITNNGDVISVELPLLIDDTDGDTSSVNITVNFEDGQDPSFGDDTGATLTESDGTETATGSIDFDNGSDAVDQIVFDSNQPSLEGITTNGEATHIDLDSLAADPSKLVLVDSAGEPVMDVTIDADGNYVVNQYQPIDQDESGTTNIELNVSGTDADGDTANGTIHINIEDAEANDTSDIVDITEGDLEDGSGYPVSGTDSVLVDSSSDDLKPETLHVDPAALAGLESDLDSLTSNGQAIDFEIVQNPDGSIEITGNLADGDNILTMTMTPTLDADGNVSVTTEVTQNGPLDHLDSSSDYITVNGDQISIDVPLVMEDNDGTESHIDITVNIEDGQNPSFGTDTGATLTEGDDGVDTASGDIHVDTGSDEVVDVRFSQDQSQFDGITSNGQETSMVISEDGHTLTIVDSDNNPVMEVTIDENGHYDVVQSQPIDQIDEEQDISDIKLNVDVEDADGDIGEGQITIHATDGDNATGGGDISVDFTEGDLTPDAGDNDEYGQTHSSDKVHVEPGVDDLDPSTVQVDPKVMDDLIAELNNEITTAGGAPVTFDFNQDTGVLQGVDADGNPVLDISLIAEPTADGGVDISVDMTQYQPIDHVDGDTDGFVQSQGDSITIQVPIQIQDTDGDYLDESIDFNAVIHDGENPEIISADAITVDESQIDGNDNNHQGSNAAGDGQTATGSISTDSGSDGFTYFVVDVDAFNEQNHITSQGEEVTLIDNGDGTFSGMTESGNEVFNITFSEDGTYTFSVTGALDDPLDVNNGEYITVTIPIYGIDDDGDVSNTINAEVTIKDDVPTATDLNEAVAEDAGLTYLGDVLSDAGEGADGATVTAIVINGEVIDLDSLPTATGPDGNEYHVYEIQDEDDGNQDLGTLYVSENGDVYFEPTPELVHSGSDLKEGIQFIVTDSDGDTDTANVNIVVTDQGPTMEVSGGTGQEEDGRHSTDPNDNIDDNTREGIEINMAINVGDIDEHERMGEVTITPQGDAHGVFEFNGEPITPNEDGSITIPNEAFVSVDNGDGTLSYELTGVTFVPDEDFSTVDGDLTFDVKAEAIDEDAREEVATGSFNITVEGIADTPTWNMDNTQTHYTVDEDSDNVAIKVDVDLNDTDGSESLVYHVKITEGEGELVHIDGMTGPDENGYYTIPADSIDQLAVDPADNYSGDIKLDVYATSEENGDVVAGHETADSEHQEIVINVIPDADSVDLNTSNNIKVDEDTAIHLADIVKVNESVDQDGSETYFVRISDLPEGAEVIVNGEVISPDENGFYVIPLEDLDNTDIMPPPQSNVDFTFTVDGMVVDDASITDENGNPIPVEDSDIFGSTTINVDMKGVADDPTIVNDSDDWEVSEDGKTITTTVNEDGTATIDFSFVSGEYSENNVDGAVSPDSDHSERISFAAGDLPEGVTFTDADGNPLEPTLVSTNPDVYQLKLDNLTGLQIHTADNSSTDFDFPVRIVVTEDDGSSKSFDYTIHVNVNPEVDGIGVDENGDLAGYHMDSSGLEDGLIKLNWDPTSQLVDDSEKVVGLTINGFEPGYSIVIDGEVIEPDENGSITLTDEQLAAAQADGIYLQMPEDVDTDIHLTTDVTIADQEADDPEAATAVIHGDLDVDVTSVVEEDGHVEIDDADGNKITDTDGDGDSDLYESQDPNDSWSNQIQLTTNGELNGADSINWINDDQSSDEVITKVIITFDPDSITDADGNPIDMDISGFIIPGAINNGDGTFTITADQMDNITIQAPRGFDGSVDIKVTVEVQDQGDGTEGDVSETVTNDVDLTLHFTDDHDGGNGNYVEPKAGDLTTDDTTVTADEDTSINLGDAISEGVHISTADNDGDGLGDQSNDTVSIVINEEDLPPGATINGMVYNESTGEYVYSVTPDADGNIDLSDITMDLPPDYAGTIDIPVKVIETDNTSGDTNESTMNVNVDVNPVADTPDISIEVNGTTGLDPDTMQPTEDGSGSIDGTGYEDGIIELSLNAMVGDGNNGGVNNGGLETIDNITLTVDPSQGQFVDADGNPIGDTLTIDDINDPIYFQPAPDYSGPVNIHVSGDTTDTAIVDGQEVTDSGSFDTDLSFDVVAVNDDVDMSGIDDIQASEDSGIPLTDVTGSLTDLDGSEHIVSVSITGLPDDFVIEGGENIGDGVWALPGAVDSDTTLDLSGFTIIPSDYFSGDIELTLRVYTQEDSLSDPVEKDIPIHIHIDGQADAVNTNVVTEASGDENDPDGIVLHFNAHDVDDSASVAPSDNVHEDGPEQVQVTISNVPEGATFAFPEGEDGTITYNDDGTVTIISSGSDLDSIIFYPGDANSDNWDGNLEVAIQGNDQGDTSGPVVNETIHVDVNAQNDAALNTVPETVEASQDGSTMITGLHISDVDAAEGKGDFTVQLHVDNGSLSLPEGTETSGVTISSDDNGNYTLEGSIDDINALFDAGIIYTPDESFSGDDSITMTTTDNGDADGNDRQTTVDTITITDVVSAEPSDDNTQSTSVQSASLSTNSASVSPIQSLRSQVTSTVAQVNAASVVPMTTLLLAAAVAANEGDTLQLTHLGEAQVVDADNQPLGDVAEDGTVTLTPDQIAMAYVQNVEAVSKNFTVVTHSAETTETREHPVAIEALQTAGLVQQGDVNHQTLASHTNAEPVQIAAMGDADNGLQGHDAAEILAANPEVAEFAAQHAESLTDDLHAIVDEVSTLADDSHVEPILVGQELAASDELLDKASNLQQDLHDDLAHKDQTEATSAELSDVHANEDSDFDMDDSNPFADDDWHTDIASNADDIGDSQSTEASVFATDDSDDSLYASDAGHDNSDLFGEAYDDDGLDWDHLATHGFDEGSDTDALGMESSDGGFAMHDADFDMSELLDQENGHLDMDKLLGEAAPSSAADVGKATEASADDLSSTQHLDQADISGMGMDLSGLYDTSSAGHILNDLFDPNTIKTHDG
ncbi:retention module-containing protein [Vibrio gangliei]|uniref:retention module-containing protein n=1 Tax=Vibrio gangliei TaxID=2077090 RepID=UPI000D015E09|nr:retention module-containing protein [Vibrio gangliei]